jgi:hypothetical protein
MAKNSNSTVVPPLEATPEPGQTPTDMPLVNIPLEDVVVRVDTVDQAAAAAAAAGIPHELPQPRMGDKAFQGPTRFADMPEGIRQELYDAAESDNRGFDITRAIYETRATSAVKPYTPPPVSEAQMEQTRLEMEAGRAAVAKHAAAQAHRPAPVRNDPREGNTTTVFRPDDYVPDPRKGQGLVPHISARSQDL